MPNLSLPQTLLKKGIQVSDDHVAKVTQKKDHVIQLNDEIKIMEKLLKSISKKLKKSDGNIDLSEHRDDLLHLQKNGYIDIQLADQPISHQAITSLKDQIANLENYKKNPDGKTEKEIQKLRKQAVLNLFATYEKIKEDLIRYSETTNDQEKAEIKDEVLNQINAAVDG